MYQAVKTMFLGLQVQYDLAKKRLMISEISPSCLHAIVLMFFEYPTNNVYQNTFISLIREILTFGSSAVYTIVIFQLNILNYFNLVLEKICSNGVFNKKLQIDSLFLAMRNFLRIIDNNLNVTHNLSSHLISLICLAQLLDN